MINGFINEEFMYGKIDEAEWEKLKKGAEYEYVFIPSYYAVKSLIIYYIKNKESAERIYNLKNAVVRRIDDSFYGGLPFILKYIGGDFEDERIDMAEFIEKLLDYKRDLDYSDELDFLDDFINDIIDCLNDFYKSDLILERRIKNYNESKENWFCIDFYKELEKENNELMLNYTMVEDYKILMHNDVKKDWKHLQKDQIKKANEKIIKTPKHPNNDFPQDSEALKGTLKGWFSQRISQKDRLVYKIDLENKIVYIATVCGHYDNAESRTKSTYSYK